MEMSHVAPVHVRGSFFVLSWYVLLICRWHLQGVRYPVIACQLLVTNYSFPPYFFAPRRRGRLG